MPTRTASFTTASEDDLRDELGENESTPIGLSAPNLNYEIRRKLDTMNKLHNTGVQIDIDLPQIAVIGNQSAGKSSLIEAVSGITLPRASGTCTRCPIECRLARTDAPWQCIVSLRKTTDATGNPLGQATNEQFGKIIYDKSEVEDRIRRAQRAILNPNIPLDDILKESKADAEKRTDGQLPFSVNCVTLSISGPDVADLSFCDLPGLIASVSRNDNAKSISLVENMVVSYIEKPSCIILLTVTCETDFENQGAHRLARQYDPEGKRTIGVLTKPDRIPVGEESSWIPFIRDEKEQLENNWFCVKLLSSIELTKKLSWAETRKLEEDFFSKRSSPWAEVEGPYRRYLGTTNLVERLSTVLSDLIATRVPQIQDELERSIAHTRELISRLPPPPTIDPRSDISNLLNKFMQAVTETVKGIQDDVDLSSPSGLIQSINPEHEKFKMAIHATAPQFWPFEKHDTNAVLPPAHFLRAEEGEISGKMALGPKIYIDEVYQRIQSARTRELPGQTPPVVGRTYVRNIVKQWETPSEALIKAVYSIVAKHLKQMVHDHFHHFGQGKLEQQVRVVVQGHINACLLRAENGVKYQRKLEQNWPFTMNSHYLSDYKSKFLDLYKIAREDHAEKAKPQPFQSFTSTSTFDFNSFTKPDAPKAAAGGSTGPGFTPTTPLFSSSSTSTPSGTKSNFTSSNTPRFYAPSSADKDAPGTTSSLPKTQPQPQPEPPASKSAFSGFGKTQVAESNPPPPTPLSSEHMESALDIMAGVRAYFQVAYKRFIDYVPLAVDAELVSGIAEDLLPTLFSQLGINGPKGDAICKDFAQESRKIATRRVELSKKLERLEAGHNELFTAFV